MKRNKYLPINLLLLALLAATITLGVLVGAVMDLFDSPATSETAIPSTLSVCTSVAEVLPPHQVYDYNHKLSNVRTSVSRCS